MRRRLRTTARLRQSLRQYPGWLCCRHARRADLVSVYVRTRRVLPTVEIRACSYLRPARIGRCIGEAQILRAGKNLVFVEGRLLGPTVSWPCTPPPPCSLPAPDQRLSREHRRMMIPWVGEPAASDSATSCAIAWALAAWAKSLSPSTA